MNSITPRERYMAALEHRRADRPAFSWGSGPQPPVLTELNAYLEQWGLDYKELYRRTSDERHIELRYVGRKLRRGQSIWGYTTKAVSYGTGHYDEFDYQPLAKAESVDDVESHPWPNPSLYEFGSIEEQINTIDPDRQYATVL